MNNFDDLIAYQVSLPLYEGPLDLLLQLIERAELDITKLALAQVTDQYLEYLSNLPELSASEVSGFLVIAARLIQIKSEALLPRPPIRKPGEEDPGEALARQLIIYRRYKRVAEGLNVRQQEHLRTYLREVIFPTVEGRVDLSGVELSDLVEAANLMYNRQPAIQPSLNNVITPPKVTIRQKIRMIAGLLEAQKQISFRKLFREANSRLDIVVAFLAVLELVRLNLIIVHQERIFADIDIETDDRWKRGEELELEFGE